MILLRTGRLQEPPRAPTEKERERGRGRGRGGEGERERGREGGREHAQAGYRSRNHARLLIHAPTNGVAGPSRSIRERKREIESERERERERER
jgi:hypothetical protein